MEFDNLTEIINEGDDFFAVKAEIKDYVEQMDVYEDPFPSFSKMDTKFCAYDQLIT